MTNSTTRWDEGFTAARGAEGAHPAGAVTHRPQEIAAEVGETTRGGAPRTRRKPSPMEYPATYILIAINVAVFLLMFPHSPAIQLLRQHQFSGVLMAPFDIDTLSRFGGCDNWLAVGGQWWRLLTACFVHASILHIAVNLWCLWNLGVFGEPLLGRWGLFAVYVITGVSGNLLSLSWSVFTRTDALVVGASGAIFGIAGVLIVLLSNRKLPVPWPELRNLRGQVILFAVANLALGVAPTLIPALSPHELHRLHVNPASLPHIDNTAHLGGLLSGLALGVPLLPRMLSGRERYRARQKVTFVSAALVLCLIGYALAKLAG